MSKISTILIQIEAIRCTGDYLLHLTSKNRTETRKIIFRYFLFPNLEIISGKKKILSENISVQRSVQLFPNYPLKFSAIGA